MRTRAMILALVATAGIALVALVVLPRLNTGTPDSGQVVWPTDGWPAGSPEEVGLDSQKLADGLTAIGAQGTKIDSLMVIRHGKVPVDASFYPYSQAYLHDLASVTKSFMTTLIGIAADQGKLKLDQPVLSFFPERTIANRDARKERLTVRHLVSMRNGFSSGCQAGDLPTIAAMMDEPDWVGAALDRPMASEPGAQFCYDSPGMHLLSAILQQATGMTALEFANQYLFAPLGIKDAYWPSDPQGITRGWGDLHLKPADIAKVGFLWLHGGVWEGQQIVSPGWVRDSTKYHSDFGDGDGYGFGWWLYEGGFEASGRGGQAIKVLPSMDVVVVTTGRGFDYDAEVDSYLVAAVTDLEKPLAENPGGAAALAEALRALAERSDPGKATALPAMATEVSGKTYVFAKNAAVIETLRIDFASPAEAILTLKYLGNQPASSPVGLDGYFRPAVEGELRRGYWADGQTFVLELRDADELTLAIQFRNDEVTLTEPSRGLLFVGKLKQP